MEWKKVQTKLEKVKMIPGERRRDRVLSPVEESIYFAAAHSNEMQKHMDPTLLADVDTILIDCALRPEECFRLRPANIVDDGIEIPERPHREIESAQATRHGPQRSHRAVACAKPPADHSI